MIEWLAITPADAEIHRRIVDALDNPLSPQAKGARDAYEAAMVRLDTLKEELRVQQLTVNACSAARRAHALAQVRENAA